MLPLSKLLFALPLTVLASWGCTSAAQMPSKLEPSAIKQEMVNAQASGRLSATIVSTGDGDTLRVKLSGESKPTTVRLACIDAPESSQPEGAASASRLAELLPKGKSVAIRRVDTDRYGRTVAEIYDAEGTSINSQMVADGQAVIYRRYLSGCSASEGELTSAESVAKDQRLGVWGSAGFIMPWDWRKAH